jgi:hypothetical protein
MKCHVNIFIFLQFLHFFLEKVKNVKKFYPLEQKIFSKLDIFLDIFIFTFFKKIIILSS